MSKVPSTDRISQEEMIGSAEQQVSALLRPLNLFFQDIGDALNSDLTIQENLDASILNIPIQTGPSYPADWVDVGFRHGIKRRVSGSIVINIREDSDPDAIFTSPIHADVRFNDIQGSIVYLGGLQASKIYTLTLLIL